MGYCDFLDALLIDVNVCISMLQMSHFTGCINYFLVFFFIYYLSNSEQIWRDSLATSFSTLLYRKLKIIYYLNYSYIQRHETFPTKFKFTWLYYASERRKSKQRRRRYIDPISQLMAKLSILFRYRKLVVEISNNANQSISPQSSRSKITTT